MDAAEDDAIMRHLGAIAAPQRMITADQRRIHADQRRIHAWLTTFLERMRQPPENGRE